MFINTETALSALFAISPDVSREEWVKAGMAAQAAGLSYEDFQQWSAQSGKYDERDTRRTWKSFQIDKGVGIGTLVHMAKQNGWRLKINRAHTRMSANCVPLVRSQTPGNGRPLRSQTALNPVKLWERCAVIAEGESHPYIDVKAGTAQGVRVVPRESSLAIAGVKMAGALVVPVTPLGQTDPVSLQFIAAPEQAAQWKAKGKPSKLNLPGASMRGNFVVGDLAAGATVHVVEGIGQAWACWKATGAASVVTFGWGRVKTVVAELQKKDATARIVVVPDAGKEQEAKQIATELGVEYVTMPEGWPTNSDVNDLALKDGLDALEVLLTKPSIKAEVGDDLGLDVVFADELPAGYTPPDELIEGVFTSEDGSVMYGDSNSGKTFLAIDMSISVARGGSWMGRRTEPGLVVYLAAESPNSVKGRLQAYQAFHGVTIPNFAIVQSPVNLFDEEADTQKIIDLVKRIEKERGQKVRLIVGDTLARLSAGANENAGQDMGVVIQRFDRIRKECKAHFLLIHHSGKVQAHGARGWSGIRAAVDTEIEVTENGLNRCAEITKQRDLGTKGERVGFKLSVVPLGTTKWGKPASSCVVLPSDAPPRQAKRVGEVGGAILELLRTRGTGMKKAEIVAHFAQRHHKSALYREMKNLVQAGRLQEVAGVVALASVETGKVL
jgi:putative DNA primase/helicase